LRILVTNLGDASALLLVKYIGANQRAAAAASTGCGAHRLWQERKMVKVKAFTA
jgi:hypothetical protein